MQKPDEIYQSGTNPIVGFGSKRKTMLGLLGNVVKLERAIICGHQVNGIAKARSPTANRWLRRASGVSERSAPAIYMLSGFPCLLLRIPYPGHD